MLYQRKIHLQWSKGIQRNLNLQSHVDSPICFNYLRFIRSSHRFPLLVILSHHPQGQQMNCHVMIHDLQPQNSHLLCHQQLKQKREIKILIIPKVFLSKMNLAQLKYTNKSEGYKRMTTKNLQNRYVFIKFGKLYLKISNCLHMLQQKIATFNE